jgi:hypothetical protein
VEEYRSISREAQLTESQLSELQNMRVLVEEARVLARNLAYHRRASVEAKLGGALDEVDRHIADLRSSRAKWRSLASGISVRLPKHKTA